MSRCPSRASAAASTLAAQKRSRHPRPSPCRRSRSESRTEAGSIVLLDNAESRAAVVVALAARCAWAPGRLVVRCVFR
jgi:hypothetical protein